VLSILGAAPNEGQPCSRARAFRSNSRAFGNNVPVRELSYAEAPLATKSSQAGTFLLNFDFPTSMFPSGNMVHY